MSKRAKLILIVADVILVAGLITGIFLYQKRADEKETETIGEEALSRRYTETVRYQGNEYPLSRHVTSVLLIGTDNYSDDDKQNEEDLFYNENLADFLICVGYRERGLLPAAYRMMPVSRSTSSISAVLLRSR